MLVMSEQGGKFISFSIAIGQEISVCRDGALYLTSAPKRFIPHSTSTELCFSDDERAMVGIEPRYLRFIGKRSAD